MPRDKRGKIFGLVVLFTGGMTPISMSLGGVMAEFFAIRDILLVTGVLAFMTFIPILVDQEIKGFINHEVPDEVAVSANTKIPEEDTGVLIQD
jgi:hypothetical protein